MVIAGWSILVIEAALSRAILRLGDRALETVMEGRLSRAEWMALGLSILTLTWFEGYRALHLKFVPRVVARALAVGAQSRGALGWLLAPLRTLSLTGAPRQQVLRAWGGLVLIVLAVVVVQALPAPWRGIIDGGVACALLIGLCSLAVRFGSAVRDILRAPAPTGSL